MKRLLKYELSRIIYSKRYFIIAACLLVLVILVLMFAYDKWWYLNKFPTNDGSYDAAYYQKEIEFWESFIKESGLDYNHPSLGVARRHIELDNFFLITGTTEFDYIEIAQYMTKFEGYEVFGCCFFLCEMSIYPFLITAIFAALWAFSFEKSGGTLKNLLQGSDRRTAFDGKLLVSAVLAIGLPLILFLIELIIMATCKQLPLLANDNGYKTISGVTLLAQIGLRNLLIIAFVYAATLFCTTFFKPLVSGLIVPLGIIFIGFVAMIVSNESNMILLNMQDFQIFNVFPVVGLLNYAGGFDLTFGIIAVLHAITIVLFVLFTRLRFRKMDL